MLSIEIILLLSFIQGCTEFLPISSSAHLLLIERWINLPHDTLTFDFALNLGTLFATIVYFRTDIYTMWYETKQIARGNIRLIPNALISKIFLSTIPVVIIGYLLVQFNYLDNLRNNYLLLACNLIIFGIVLYASDVLGNNTTNFYNINLRQAIFIGLFQCISLVPGVSRLGSTLIAARVQGLQRVEAIRYSFLIAIPATLGAILLTMMTAVKNGVVFYYYDMFLGFCFSFIFGLFFIRLLLKFLAQYDFKIFMIYRIILGILVLWLLV